MSLWSNKWRHAADTKEQYKPVEERKQGGKVHIKSRAPLLFCPSLIMFSFILSIQRSLGSSFVSVSFKLYKLGIVWDSINWHSESSLNGQSNSAGQSRVFSVAKNCLMTFRCHSNAVHLKNTMTLNDNDTDTRFMHNVTTWKRINWKISQ